MHTSLYPMALSRSVNYANLWLSLIAPPSAQTQANRRKYAQLVGKISPEMYPVFESAITVSDIDEYRCVLALRTLCV